MHHRLIAVAALLLCAAPARADPGYYVVTVYDRAQETTVDARYWTFKHDGWSEAVWPEIGISYGVNSRWTTGLLESWVGTTQTAVRRSTLNWQNQVLLTQGEWPVDLGLWASVIKSQTEDFSHALEWGPLLQTDIGRTQLNANVFFEHVYGAQRAASTQMKYQWQAKYRWRPGWHLGVQGFGELGPWSDWAPQDRQSHRAGPTLVAGLPTTGKEQWSIQAAYLFGKTYGVSGQMFSLRVAYGF